MHDVVVIKKSIFLERNWYYNRVVRLIECEALDFMSPSLTSDIKSPVVANSSSLIEVFWFFLAFLEHDMDVAVLTRCPKLLGIGNPSVPIECSESFFTVVVVGTLREPPKERAVGGWRGRDSRLLTDVTALVLGVSTTLFLAILFSTVIARGVTVDSFRY